MEKNHCGRKKNCFSFVNSWKMLTFALKLKSTIFNHLKPTSTMKNICKIIQENREEAIAILSTLPNKEVKLIDNLNWGSIEQEGILADEDAIDNEELRDLPCVVVATDKLCQLIVIKVFLKDGDIYFYGVNVQDYDNYLEEDIYVYHSSDCAAYYDNILYEIVEDYTNLKK